MEGRMEAGLLRRCSDSDIILLEDLEFEDGTEVEDDEGTVK